ncbi:MAG: bifunctional adenosylcobinamide kinase/adenosylcobinamide-phosphate guanylyltransferase [Chlorobium sp.]|jgi:adenosylcobinamide kinase/adenosylcobinamide-phosphate guanylyltransferase|nr:bifunctional adenosylcobinamide kinase/adenosylcobinamide-phosphate guanylyltransferase [Chlorobium sp.]
MHRIIYVTGGARSGKSSYALSLALGYANRYFLATAEPFDDEMQERIRKHRLERKEGFTTIEEPLFLDRALSLLPDSADVVLLDCLTVWSGNMMHHLEDDKAIDKCITALLAALPALSCDCIVVSNEVGMGIVPENPLARRFRDIAGIVNQKVAALATDAYLLCSGIPLKLR